MKPNSLFIIGCGDLGSRTAGLLDPADFTVAGVRRNTDHLPAQIIGYAADYSQPGSLSFLGSIAPDYVLATFKPAQMSPQGYQLGFTGAVRNLIAGLGSHKPKAIVMISSTRVYAERDGGWVVEASPLASQGYAAEAIIEAEHLLQRSGHRSCIIRFGGIYGDPEGRMLRRIGRGEVCAAEPARYSNRIHRDDCARFIAHLLKLPMDRLAPVYNGVDSEPVLQLEVEQWLAERLGVKMASSPGHDTTGNRIVGSKRCSNKLMRGSGFELHYPDYRTGYEAVLANQ